MHLFGRCTWTEAVKPPTSQSKFQICHRPIDVPRHALHALSWAYAASQVRLQQQHVRACCMVLTHVLTFESRCQCCQRPVQVPRQAASTELCIRSAGRVRQQPATQKKKKKGDTRVVHAPTSQLIPSRKGHNGYKKGVILQTHSLASQRYRLTAFRAVFEARRPGSSVINVWPQNVPYLSHCTQISTKLTLG